MLYISQAAALCFGKESPKDCKIWICSSHCSVELSHAASSFFVWSTSEWVEFSRCKRGNRFANPGDWLALSSHWADRYKINMTFGIVCELVKRKLQSAYDEIWAKHQSLIKPCLALNNDSLKYIQDSQQDQFSLYHTMLCLTLPLFIISVKDNSNVHKYGPKPYPHFSPRNLMCPQISAQKFFAIWDMSRSGKGRNVWACRRVPE